MTAVAYLLLLYGGHYLLLMNSFLSIHLRNAERSLCLRMTIMCGELQSVLGVFWTSISANRDRQKEKSDRITFADYVCLLDYYISFQ